MSDLDQRTVAHLKLADENLHLAYQILDIESPPQRWVAVIAFYASVHYVGAFAWEHIRVTVRNHRHRARLVESDEFLSQVADAYTRLCYLSLQARYNPSFDPPTSEPLDLLDTDLARIRSHINDRLGRR